MDIRRAITLVEGMAFDRDVISEEPEAHEYPTGLFYLPTDTIVFYDDPYDGVGDDGWDVEGIKKSIMVSGQEQPIEVGRSVYDMENSGNQAVCAFNGNHRLAACKELKRPVMLCMNSGADDADPLTTQEILTLGGKLA